MSMKTFSYIYENNFILKLRIVFWVENNSCEIHKLQ